MNQAPSPLSRRFGAVLAVLLAVLFFPGVFGRDKKPKAVVMPDFEGWMKVCQEYDKTVKFYPGGMIKIDTGFMGNLTIEGGEKSEVRIHAVITGYGKSQEEMMQSLKAISPRLTRTETLINLTTEHGEGFQKGKIDYHLIVPKYRTDMKIFSQRGFICIRNVHGWLEGDTCKGYLQLANLSGYVSLRTLEGDVQVQLKGRRWEGLQCCALTESGNAKVFIPSDYNADVTFIALRGPIDVDFPKWLVDEEDQEVMVGIKKEGAFISQRIREGGPNIVVQTSAGHLSIQQYDPEKQFLDSAPVEEMVPSPLDLPENSASPAATREKNADPPASPSKEKENAPNSHP